MLSLNINIPDWLAYSAGFTLFLISIALVALNSRQRAAVLDRFHIHHRRASGATTPPRDLSPDKTLESEKMRLVDKTITNSASTIPDHPTAFPPSRRWVLPILAELAVSSKQQQVLSGPDPPKDVVQNAQLPRSESFKSVTEAGEAKYLPNGFSTAEIQALGDFPAYDILSGVRLPKAYEEFDPSKALSRPYRPFRWAYHQTMCKTLPFNFPSTSIQKNVCLTQHNSFN